MSLAKKSIDKKISRNYWVKFVDKSNSFITAKQIAFYVLIISGVIQTIGQFIEPSDWLIWNTLTFIVATNLGAVLLAIHAQKSADDIRDMYDQAFNADFYHTLYLMSKLKNSIADSAHEDGNTLEGELDALGGDVYGAFKGYLKTFNEHMNTEVEVVESKEFGDEGDDGLFN